MATILVADDDQLFRAIIRDQLERADHTVIEAGDGMAALDLALDERPEVLLLDVMMPLARGLEVVRRVRQQEDWYPAIVMISARTRVTDRLNALEAGADGYVEKPVAPDDLLDTIHRLLTEVAPARYVDVLGPIWATLALERLAERAIARYGGDTERITQVEQLFTGLVAASISRVPCPTMSSGGAALRLLWENALRVLLHDSVTSVPVVTHITPPDILAAVERTIGDATLRRHRARLGHDAPLADFWQTVVRDALSIRGRDTPTPRRRAPAADKIWSRRLRDVLSDDDVLDELGARWSVVLRGVLAHREHGTPTVATIDPLGPVWLAAADRAAQSEGVR